MYFLATYVPYKSPHDQVSLQPFDRDFQALHAGMLFSFLIYWPKKFFPEILSKMVEKYCIYTLTRVYIRIEISLRPSFIVTN